MLDATERLEWQTLMTLFEELSDVPENEREALIDAKQLNDAMRARLGKMLRTLDSTISLLDTPITERVQLPSQWYADQWVGKQINQYRIDKLLHEGNIAGVFVATQLEPVSRQVAIKLIRPEASEDFREFFRSEQRTLAKLNHPNIASIYTVEVSEEGLSFSVMEFIEGSSLSTYCDTNELSVRGRLSLFLDICDAVSYAHQRGVLHRDLKSSNILVRNFEGKATPTLIDFDISSDLNDQINRADDQLMGTPEYMSPEHVLNQNDTDVRADVYSLGMVMFTLLVGAIPFDRSRLPKLSRAQRLAAIAEFETLKPSEHFKTLTNEKREQIALSRGFSPGLLEQQLTAGLDYVFLKATHKDRELRYQTVTEFAQDIRHFLDKKPVTAHPKSLLYAARKFVQRNAIPTALAAAMVVLGILFSSKVINQGNQLKVESERAEQEHINAEQAAEMVMQALDIAQPETANVIGRDSVAELVNQAFDRFRDAEGTSPKFRARLLIKLADAFRHTERKEKAREVEAMIVEEMDTFAPLDKADLLKTLVMGANNDGDFEAMVVYAGAIEQLSTSAEISDQLLIDAKVRKAQALVALSRLDEAKATLDESRGLYESVALNYLPVKARMYVTAAELAASQRRYHDAEDHFTTAIEAYTEHYSPTDRRVVHTRLSEINFLTSIDHPRATSDTARDILADVIRIWGTQSYAENVMLYHLGSLLAKEQKYEEAQAQIAANLQALEEQGLVRDQLYVAGLGVLSGVYVAQGHSDKAVEASLRSHELVKMTSEDGPEHLASFVAEIEQRYSIALLANEQLEEALYMIESSIDFYNSNKAKEFADSILIRAYIYSQTKDLNTARQDVQSATTFLMMSAADTTTAERKAVLQAALMERYIEYLERASESTAAGVRASLADYQQHLNGGALPFPYSQIPGDLK